MLIVGCGKHFFERLRKTRSVEGRSVPAYIIVGPALEGKHPGLTLFFRALRAMTTSPKEYWINKLVEEHGHADQHEALRYGSPSFYLCFYLYFPSCSDLPFFYFYFCFYFYLYFCFYFFVHSFYYTFYFYFYLLCYLFYFYFYFYQQGFARCNAETRPCQRGA